MDKFKVICKNDSGWHIDLGLVLTTKKSFFGLISKTIISRDKRPISGPTKEEICIVLDVREDGYYKLAGYTQYGWYTPLPFIRLDEFEETQKEIAKKSQPQLN